jgi:hypothetical protein
MHYNHNCDYPQTKLMILLFWAFVIEPAAAATITVHIVTIHLTIFKFFSNFETLLVEF